MVKRFSYDAWGKRRLENWQSTEEQVASEVGRIGFTGHEMLDELGLIHMNGRVYDPTIGRFLSADPFIQDNWFGTQAFNRYSYVQNNPLSYTDPSGYMAMVDHTETGTGGGGGWSDQHEKDDFDYGEILDPDIAGNQQELKYGSNSDFIEGRNKPPAPQNKGWSLSSVLDRVHAVLDVAGQIPGVGIGADLLNAAVYLGRGQIVNAGISAAGALPVVGHAATTGRIAKRVTKSADNLVYQSTKADGTVDYVGITNNLERRAAEHLGQKGISIDAIPGLSNLSRADARAVEQVLIESHGLGKNGGTLLNKINSISQKNPVYAESLTRGGELLKGAGYPGF